MLEPFAEWNAANRLVRRARRLSGDELFRLFRAAAPTLVPADVTRQLHALDAAGVCGECERRARVGEAS